MNQSSKNIIGVSPRCYGQRLLSLFICGTIALATSATFAQNQFRPITPQTNFQQPELGSWTPPNTTGSFYDSRTGGNAATADTQPPAVSFPESIVPFETGIRTANFEAPAVDLQTDPSITD